MGVLRSRDLEKRGISRVYLSRLVEQGKLIGVGRGLYSLPDAEVTENHSLVGASKRIPDGVICLLSALRFHDLTTQNPHEVWVAIRHHKWRPRQTGVKIRLVHFSGKTLAGGVEEHSIERVPVMIFSAAKTVADCFKFRNSIGLDVTLESLREYERKFPGQRDALWEYASICRVTRILEPYLEAMS